MNILLLSTHLNAGGITSYLLTLSKGLIDQGHAVHVASSGGDTENEFIAMGAIFLKLNIRTKSELSPKLYNALGLLKKYIEENSIHVIHSQTRITQVMGQLLMKSTGCPYLSTCHGYFKARLSRRIAPCWGRDVIAISEAVRGHLKKDFEVLEENIVLIPNGIDLNKFQLITDDKRRSVRAELHLSDDEPVLGIIARLSDIKGQDILIPAMKQVAKEVSNVKLLIVGEGRMESSLKEMVQSLKLNDHIFFYPVVNQTVKYLSALDIFVMPSRQEGLGLSVMEAQACGLPAVASNVGGLPSLIKNGTTGILVEPQNPDALGKALVELLKNPQGWKPMGLAARKFIEETYPSGKMVDKTIELYRRLANT